MNRNFGKILLAMLIVMCAYGWETIVIVDGEHSREMAIGMEFGATEGFDRDLDVAAPPVPPVGFYCYMPMADTSFEFLDAVWKDIRKPDKSADWKLRLVRPTKPPQIRFRNLPTIGKITVNNIDAVEESLALTFAKSDTEITIKYRRGFWEEPLATIDFETNYDGEAIIVIKDQSGKPVRRLPDMFLKAGEHSIGWNATDNRGNEVEAGLYYARISLRFGDEFSDFEVETVVKSKENSNE